MEFFDALALTFPPHGGEAAHRRLLHRLSVVAQVDPSEKPNFEGGCYTFKGCILSTGYY